MRFFLVILAIIIALSSFAFYKNVNRTTPVSAEVIAETVTDTIVTVAEPAAVSNIPSPAPTPAPAPNATSNASAGLAMEYANYAKTLVGTPYVWGSVNPAVGFDCSGFVTHVSNHFGIKVPRSSVDFTNVGLEVDAHSAQPGDLILFTGTNPASRIVGHMGIVTENENGNIQFVHSSSGKAKGVTVSDMSQHYQERFVKVIRIFPLNENKVVA